MNLQPVLLPFPHHCCPVTLGAWLRPRLGIQQVFEACLCVCKSLSLVQTPALGFLEGSSHLAWHV